MKLHWFLIFLAASLGLTACADSDGAANEETTTTEDRESTPQSNAPQTTYTTIRPADPTTELPSPVLSPAASTLFDVTSAPTEGGPPFYVMADRLSAGSDATWAIHQFTIVSEWRTPIAVSIPPTRYILDPRGFANPDANEAERREPIIIQPGAALALVLSLEPGFTGGPAPGFYQIEVPIAYWRNVDPSDAPTGPEENILTLRVAYEILDSRTASAISTFCSAAIEAAPDLAELDKTRITSSLDTIETAAETLPQAKRHNLMAAISDLRLQLEEWFSPEPLHSGFSTGKVIELVNYLCGTELTSISVQA